MENKCVLCGKPMVAKKWCQTHYQRFRRTGNTSLIRKRGRKPLPYCSACGISRVLIEKIKNENKGDN